MSSNAELTVLLRETVRQLSLRDEGDGSWLHDLQLKSCFSPSLRKVVVAYRNEIRIDFALTDEEHEASAARRKSYKACSTSELVTDIAWFHYHPGKLQQGADPPWHPRSQDTQRTVDQPAATDALDAALLVGTEAGYLQIHDSDGEPLLRQRIHTTPLHSIQLHARYLGSGEEDLTLVFEDAIARVAASEVVAALRRCCERRAAGRVEEVPAVAVQKWLVPKGVGPRFDGICLGVKAPDLYSVLQGKGSRTVGKLNIITGGKGMTIAAMEADEQAQKGTLAVLTEAASSLATGVFDFARSTSTRITSAPRAIVSGAATYLINSLYSRGGAPKPHVHVHDAPEDMPPPEAAGLWRSLQDPKRAVMALTASPCGRLVAATDNLGRVLLVETASMAVVRMWKGYRDAQCGWIERHVPPRQDPVQLLVVHAPRRQALEVWLPRQGRRVCTLSLENPCRLLPAACPFGLPAEWRLGEGGLLEGAAAGWLHTCWLLEAPTGCLVDVSACVEGWL